MATYARYFHMVTEPTHHFWLRDIVKGDAATELEVPPTIRNVVGSDYDENQSYPAEQIRRDLMQCTLDNCADFLQRIKASNLLLEARQRLPHFLPTLEPRDVLPLTLLINTFGRSELMWNLHTEAVTKAYMRTRNPSNYRQRPTSKSSPTDEDVPEVPGPSDYY